MKKLQKARYLYDLNKVWTNAGKLMVKGDNNQLTKTIIFYQ